MARTGGVLNDLISGQCKRMEAPTVGDTRKITALRGNGLETPGQLRPTAEAPGFHKKNGSPYPSPREPAQKSDRPLKKRPLEACFGSRRSTALAGIDLSRFGKKP